MSAYEMALLFDYYGSMLTEKQKEYFDMRYNQDLSLGEIGEIQGVSRQAVFDNLTRTENLLRRMEENIGCIKRDMQLRKALEEFRDIAAQLGLSSDPQVTNQAKRIIAAVQSLKE